MSIHEHTRWPQSQCHTVGTPPPRSWNDYEKGCIGTFGGGYRTKEEREIFHHGMSTVFNLLRGEFPPAGACKNSGLLLAACEATVSDIDRTPGIVQYGHVDSISLETRALLRTAIDAARGETTP